MSDIESTAPVIVTPAPVAESVAPATPEPEAPAAQETETPKEGEEQAAKSEGPTDQERAFQKRLGIESRRLKRQLEAEIRAEYAEKQLAELKAPPRVETPSGKPAPAQFESYEDYMDALTDWKVDQRMQSLRQETEIERTQRQMAERANTVLPKLKPAMEKYDDFQEVATSFKAPPALQAAMLESDHTGELYYYLGSNPAELDRISRLSDVKQVLAVKELESKLNAVPQATKAPAPIVPNGGKAPVTKHFSDMSYEEFEEHRRKFKARKR